MKNFLAFSALMCTVVAVFQFCVKPPDYPDEPVIKFKNLTKNIQLQSAIDDTDTLLVTLEFTDGDGDLGSADKANDISVIDSRDNSGDTLSLPLIEQQGAGNGISGEISFVLPPTCCIPPPLNGIPLPPCDPSVAPNFLRDTVVYRVRIRDRAGHLSNEVALPPIILICKQ